MAIGDYSKTTWNNGGPPAINATNLNKIENKINELDKHGASRYLVAQYFSDFITRGVRNPTTDFTYSIGGASNEKITIAYGVAYDSTCYRIDNYGGTTIAVQPSGASTQYVIIYALQNFFDELNPAFGIPANFSGVAAVYSESSSHGLDIIAVRLYTIEMPPETTAITTGMITDERTAVKMYFRDETP